MIVSREGENPGAPTPGLLRGNSCFTLAGSRSGIIPVAVGIPTEEDSRQAGRHRGKDKSVRVERPKRPERAPYTPEVFCEVMKRLAHGEFQHDIAAELGWNQGRVSEVKTGKRGTNPDQPSLF